MTNEKHKADVFTPALTLWGSRPDIKFGDLVSAVKNVHQCSSQAAIKAVNRYATMRNWIIGFFIVEYQQKGNDRAAYGERLLKCLEESLHIRGLNVTLFQNCRLFYVLYPQVGNLFLIENKPTLSVKSVVREFQPTALVELQSNAETIVGKLSFSHLCELVHISDDTTRLFYEKECIRCGWSVRELRRFIATNLHVRVGMSQNSDAVIASLPSGNSKALDIRQPYTFEFLGLRATEVHCSVIVELKNDEFRHEHFGQLNAYVSYYKENEMHEGDNPPIGILLCTKAGKKMVEYATAGMDNKLFVSTYLLQLPDKSVLEQFIKDNDII